MTKCKCLSKNCNQCQSCLIRLGKDIGNIDGLIGRKTQKASEELSIPFTIENPGSMMIELENRIQKGSPNEINKFEFSEEVTLIVASSCSQEN